MTMRSCPACGYSAPAVDDVVHAYLTHSPECWAQFNVSMGLHFSELVYWPAHQWLVDAYTLQHSPGDDRRAVQSAAIHLAALVLRIEKPDVPDEAVIRLRKGLSKRSAFPRFDAYPAASVTIASVSTDAGPDDHLQSVLNYANTVYADWEPHQPAARALIAEVEV